VFGNMVGWLLGGLVLTVGGWVGGGAWWFGGLVAWWLGGLVAWWLGEWWFSGLTACLVTW